MIRKKHPTKFVLRSMVELRILLKNILSTSTQMHNHQMYNNWNLQVHTGSPHTNIQQPEVHPIHNQVTSYHKNMIVIKGECRDFKRC